MIEAILLGTGGMLPLPKRWLSSLLMRVNGEIILFDCGEGTQIAWREQGWSFRRLAAICISHTHADHIAGLPGLLHTVANAGRVEPIELFGPPGVAEVVGGLRAIAPVLPFQLRVTELQSGTDLALPGGLQGSCLEGEHQVPVLAYRADLPRAREFRPGRARALDVPINLWRRLQLGEPVAWDEGAAEPEQVLGPPRRGRSVAYVTDTRPLPAHVTFVAGVDLLVCEATYGSEEDAAKAIANRHMTFREAATLARDADAGRLWLTHFSPALSDPEAMAANATEMFPASTVGFAGLRASLTFDQD